MTPVSGTAPSGRTERCATVECRDLDALIVLLEERGFTVIGPTLRDGAIVYDRIESTGDLPAGWTADQDNGRYRLRQRADRALFGYAVGLTSWKRFLYPPEERLFQISRDGPSPVAGPPQSLRLAFLGIRSCELRAIALQDQVFQTSDRGRLFLVAVHCGSPAGTCFCASLGAGPRVEAGFDLALTEILEGAPRFVVEAGSKAGEEVLSRLAARDSSPADLEAAERTLARAADSIRRSLPTAGLKELLYSNLEHPHWQEVAARCLACANCTMVCPTCFCSTVEDASSLDGATAERWRRWDSCFSLQFSYIHGGSVRTSVAARYRQWLTHKLAYWQDQFGAIGCVGCGRCITWWPEST